MPSAKPQKKVAISGITSFTGVWIADAFARAGWEVHGLASRPQEEYTGLPSERLKWIRAKKISLHFNQRVERGDFVSWIAKNRPTIWVNHHHPMKNYRTPEYDGKLAAREGVEPLAELTDALKNAGALGVIQSGTVFEKTLKTPYAFSKAQVWDVLKKQCEEKKILLSKIMIPNPIGPFENSDRLIPVLVEKARTGDTFPLQDPKTVANHLPADDLAKEYVRAAEDLLEGKPFIREPQGKIVALSDLISEIVVELIQKRLKLLAPRLSGMEIGAVKGPDWSRFWDAYAEYFLTNQATVSRKA